MYSSCRTTAGMLDFQPIPRLALPPTFWGAALGGHNFTPPLAVESLQSGDEQLENVITIALMAKHGFQLVRGGRYVAVHMPIPPPPIVKAYSINPPPPVHAEMAAEAVCGHSVTVTQLREEGESAWRARVTGEKAARTCPARGFKTIYAPDEAQLRERVEQWLDEP